MICIYPHALLFFLERSSSDLHQLEKNATHKTHKRTRLGLSIGKQGKETYSHESTDLWNREDEAGKLQINGGRERKREIGDSGGGEEVLGGFYETLIF